MPAVERNVDPVSEKVVATAEMATSEAGPSSSPLSNLSVRDSSLSPPLSDVPTPATRRSGRGAAGQPSPLRQAVPRMSPAASRSSRKRPLSAEQEAAARPNKLARRGKMQSSGEVGGDEEIAVEDMVLGLEDEEMTPVPDIGSEIVIEPEEEEEEQEEPEEAEEGYGEKEEEIEAETSDEVAVEAEAKEADEDEKFPPGTLGKFSPVAGLRFPR